MCNMGTKRNEVKILLNDFELLEYNEFLRPFAGKKGPYAKALLFKHIREQQKAVPQAANQEFLAAAAVGNSHG